MENHTHFDAMGQPVPVEVSAYPIHDENGQMTKFVHVCRDMTERTRAEQALRESETKFRTLSETVAAAAFIFQDTRIRYVNRTAEALTGYSRQELEAMRFPDIIHPDHRQLVRERGLARQRGEQVPLRYEVKILTKWGDQRWVDFTAGSIEFDGAPAVLGTAFDITARKTAEDQIKYQAYHDALTGLPNRALFKDRLTMALAQARRSGETLAVMFLNLDRFKLVNDTVGHDVGDRMLQAAAERLTGLLRDGDTMARVGGDEFTLLLRDISSLDDVRVAATRILEGLWPAWLLAGQEFHISASIGIAVYPSDGDDAKTLLRNADTAMYRAKDNGGNSFQIFTPAMNTRVLERVALEKDLRHALERQEFVLHYQPQVSIETGQIVGTEALVRWQHPELGLVAPMEFIPIAEETGLIEPLGEWVLRTACAQNKAWQDAGLAQIRVAVNLSACQFQQAGLLALIERVLKETGLAPGFLELEITEGTAMRDVEFTISVLKSLREMGVHVAIDDFGTGYSSLSYLKRLPVDGVKIDQSFVRDIAVDSDDDAIVAATIGLARTLDLTTIAEGVETEAQLAFLKERRCQHFQGFLVSRPVPAEELQKMLGKKWQLAVSASPGASGRSA